MHVLKDVSINMNYTDENSDTLDKDSAKAFQAFPSKKLGHQPFTVEGRNSDDEPEKAENLSTGGDFERPKLLDRLSPGQGMTATMNSGNEGMMSSAMPTDGGRDEGRKMGFPDMNYMHPDAKGAPV